MQAEPDQPTSDQPNLAAQALGLAIEADRRRATAAAIVASDPTGASLQTLRAQEADTKAQALLALPEIPAVGTGGELDLQPEAAFRLPGLVDTVRRPDAVSAEASRERLELAGLAGALALGADAAETIQAQNSIEKMLAHQLAGAHATAMRMLGRCEAELNLANTLEEPHRCACELAAARLASTAARLMTAYQTGTLTLARLRGGARQTVVVQHVAVGDGGQAVVAAKLRASGHRPGPRPAKQARNGK